MTFFRKDGFFLKAYRIEMNFKCFFGIKEMNNFLREVGGLGKDAGYGIERILTITQTMLDIPDEEYLEKVAEIIKDVWNKDKNSKQEILSSKFESFGKITKINLPEGENIEG